MFKNPFSFNGRIRRSEYGLSFLIYLFGSFFLGFILGAMGIIEPVILFFFSIPFYWFMFAQGAKRCHDLGNSGWWQLIPFYGFWLLLRMERKKVINTERILKVCN